MDTDTLLERFEREYMEINSISAERRVVQERVLRLLAAGLDHDLDALTAQDLTVFIGARLARGVHPNTARKELGMVRSFINWGFSVELIDALRTFQLKSVRNPRGSTHKMPPRPYKATEIHALHKTLAEKYPVLPQYGKGSLAMRQFMHGRVPRLQRHLWRYARRLQFEAQIAMALEQGLRRIEIAGLTIPSMHYDNDEVVVLTAKQRPGSKVKRTIPFASHARSVVQQWLDFRLLLRPPHEEPWLMLALQGTLDMQLAPQTFLAFARSLGKCLGGEWEWHRLRHTAATEWLRSGVPLEKVRVFMGHASIEQTEAYTEILSSDVSAAFGEADADFAKRLGLAA